MGFKKNESTKLFLSFIRSEISKYLWEEKGKTWLVCTVYSVVCIYTCRGTFSHGKLSNTGYLYKGQVTISLDSERYKYILLLWSPT